MELGTIDRFKNVDRDAIREQKSKHELMKDREAEAKRFFEDDEKRKRKGNDGDEAGDKDDGEDQARNS